LEKTSFTLLETLISLIIIAVLIGGVTKFINNNSNITRYNELQNANNNLNTEKELGSYENFNFKK